MSNMEGEGKQAQFLLLMSMLDREDPPLQKKCIIEEFVDISKLTGGIDIMKENEEESPSKNTKCYLEENQSLEFMQTARRSRWLPPFPSAPTPLPPRSAPSNMLAHAREFLFLSPFKIGRVFTMSGSTSGTGWISTPPYIITCAHVVNEAKQEQLYVQLPDDTTIVKLKTLFVRPSQDYQGDYRRDVAFLEMISVMGTTAAISSLPLAGIEAGELDWTLQCVSAGMLAPSSTSETQKMLNPGTVESLSSTLATTNARADKGFSGGPILNKDMHIIGMIQGGHGEVMKSVQIIPICEISNASSIVSQFIQFPPIVVPMAVSGSNPF
ncbi:hypothetical protein L7F22_029017 [Adiantum nelumboides]|nr:hypothetical protein [Adiantum nelumboides]